MTSPHHSTRHVTEMTVAEIEAFERLHHIPQSMHVVETRRVYRAEIDAAAMAARASNQNA